MEYCGSEVMETVIMSDIESMNEARLVTGVIEHLKSTSANLKSKSAKDNFCSLLYGICGDNLFNEDFIPWFAQKLGKRKHRLIEMMTGWLSATSEPLEKRGRKSLPIETKQLIFDVWHTHSIVSG